MNVTIGSILILIVVFLVLKFATKFIVKLVAVLCLLVLAIAAMYYYSWGPFEKESLSLDELKQNYCGEGGDEDICQCIVKLLEADLDMRVDEEERSSLESDKLKSLYAMQKSLSTTKPEAMECLAAKGEEDKYEEFLKDFIPIENNKLDLIIDQFKKAGEKVEGAIDSLKNGKDWIDEKY